LDLVAFGPFKRWYHKQQIGYKLTKHYLFTPRGSRYALCSPRFQRALNLTGVVTDSLRQAPDIDPARSRLPPEVSLKRLLDESPWLQFTSECQRC
jgi:hypothetical protein